MKKQANIIIKKNYFERNYKITKNIYNITETLNCFCKFHDSIEEIANITPIVELLKDESDKLCFNLGQHLERYKN